MPLFFLACTGFVCGKGAQCIVSSSGPTCKCAEGTRGNPFAGGECFQDLCSPSKPCVPSATCISGRCREKCQGVVCGVGAKCDPNTNQCICEPLFVGNPDLICMPRKSLYNLFSWYIANLSFFLPMCVKLHI